MGTNINNASLAFITFSLLLTAVFLLQRLNNGGYGSYETQTEKAKLYRSSKDQVMIHSWVQ